jgi:hypothetical protein
MTSPTVDLHELPGEYVIARFPTTQDPSALNGIFETGAFVSVTRTPQELSVVCPVGAAPAGAELDGPWVALYAAGPIPFGLTGVVTSLVSPLSAVGCPVFVVSTFDGDVLMVPSANADRARAALIGAGHVLA